MNRSHVACALLALGIAGTSIAIWNVQAQNETSGASVKVWKIKTLAETTAILQQPCGLPQEKYENSVVRDLFASLGEIHGVVFRFDPVMFSKHAGYKDLGERTVTVASVKGLTVQDVLEVIIEQISEEGDHPNIGLQSRAGQILIAKRFITPAMPGIYKTGHSPTVFVPEHEIARMLTGPTVHLAVQDKTLAEIVHLLREQTGANIVLDPRVGNLADKKLTLTFNDAKLRTVLKLATNLCDLGVAVVDNAFIVTTDANADFLMTETELNLFGKPIPDPKGK